ncbi:MAG: gamma-glutamylcyclotransferase [Pyrinomonadaceae bacterium]
MCKHLVFVYGTLRQGGMRAMPCIFPDSKFIGKANVGGSLYDFGTYPGLLLDETHSPVVGEVYEVGEEILNRLDDIESSSYYSRKQVEVSLGERSAVCWVYEPDSELYPRRTLITSGDWIEYAGTKTGWPEDAWPDED